MHPLIDSINQEGFALIPGVFSPSECERLAAELHETLAACQDENVSLRRQGGVIYGARNLLDIFPPARTLWQRPPLGELLAAVLGPDSGLVRGLFFDKPPQGNWSLPWHQDLTIAVVDHSLPSERFKNRTMKAGVPHVEAPRELLERMVTLRIHLDEVTDENGPLQVIPGSHHDNPSHRLPHTVLASAGDVLAIRPLVSHASGPSAAETSRHRRIIHLEFAADAELPDGYQWRHFIRPATCQASSRQSN
jgi:hypothetical protein